MRPLKTEIKALCIRMTLETFSSCWRQAKSINNALFLLGRGHSHYSLQVPLMLGLLGYVLHIYRRKYRHALAATPPD
jgi:hypothetical protein